MRRIVNIGSGRVWLCAITMMAMALPVSGARIPIYSTGVVSLDPVKLAADGAADPHYKLIGSTGVPGTNAYVAGPNGVYPLDGPWWLPNGSDSKWISPRIDFGTVQPVGTSVYRTTFDLSGLDPRSAVLTGKWVTDNTGTVILNGVTLSMTSATFASWSQFTISSGFVAGVNTLDFVVSNTPSSIGPSVTGLRVEISGEATPTIPEQILPQFAFGGGWYSALYFTNTGTENVSFSVNFLSDSGLPLNVPTAGGSSSVVNLAPRGTAIIEAPNAGPLNQGYVAMSLPAGVESYGVFRQSAPGVADQEAVVPISAALSATRTLIWDETTFTTAVAIVNPAAVAGTVAITVRNTNGQIIGTSTYNLAPKSKTAVVLRTLPGLAGMLGTRGSADFTTTTGSVAVLGLRFWGAAFTSIPTAAP